MVSIRDTGVLVIETKIMVPSLGAKVHGSEFIENMVHIISKKYKTIQPFFA